MDLAKDIRLVKAAILYADHVTLASLVAAMIEAVTGLLASADDVRARRLIEVASVLMDQTTRDKLALLGSRQARRRIPGHKAFEARLRTSASDVEQLIVGLRNQSGIGELAGAIDAGLLDVDDLGLDPVDVVQDSVLMASGKPRSNEVRDAGVRAFVNRIGSAATTGSGTYPLFDEGASDLVAAMIREGELPNPATRAAGQSGLAGHFVGYVPAFPDATMAEIVDVRRGLERPLVRFRGALSEMAAAIDMAPWDAEFAQVADDLYRARIAPAIADLEENARDSGAMQLFRHVALSKAPWAVSGAVLALALTGATSLPDLAAAAFSIGAPVAAVAAAAAEAAKERIRLQRAADHNQFLFLYRANLDLWAAHLR